MSDITVQVNDWVRFYQSGRLVVGVVMYLRACEDRSDTEVHTDIGMTHLVHICEVRSWRSLRAGWS